ncbi:hypothetical protein B0H14DRAFT_3514798 [Mycena olivaceomarginata]|nr:hypothetical protein B0H14DRAFT_3514798 [Mycena olivaceomarginata]
MSTNPTPIPSSSAAPTVPTPRLPLSLYTTESSKRKRPSFATMSAFEKLISCCKFSIRAVHPYMSLTEVMIYGPDRHWGTAPATCPSNTVSVPASEIERQNACVKAFDKTFSIAPELLPVIKQIYLEITVKPQQWQLLVKVMREAATSARTSDTSGLKHELTYFLPNPLKNVLTPPIPKQESKSDPWPQSPCPSLPPLVFARAPATNTASSLASSSPPPDAGAASTSPDAGATSASPDAGAASSSAPDAGTASSSPPDAAAAAAAEFLKRIVEGKVPLKTRTYPSCFYAEDSYDPANLDNGLLHGEVIPRILRHIWTGLKTAIVGVEKSLHPTCNARLHNHLHVSPEMIGYACVQARTMLGTKEWVSRDSSYDYTKVFDRIVALFAIPDDPWAKETLEWYQREVFGNADVAQCADSDESSDEEDVLAQRAARRGPSATPAFNTHRLSLMITNTTLFLEEPDDPILTSINIAVSAFTHCKPLA